MNTIQVTEAKGINQIMAEMESGQTLSDGVALAIASWARKERLGTTLEAFLKGHEVEVDSLAIDIESAGLYPREYSFLIDWVNSKMSDRIV